jgi:uncharacterized protein DUF1360
MMDEMGFWPRLVLAVLAVWRATHLLASEDGPFDLIARLRARLGNGFAGKLMDCFYCLSLWIAALAATLLSVKPLEWLLATLALSGAACLLERLGQEPVVIQPLNQFEQGEINHGMLRSETDEHQRQSINNSPNFDAERVAADLHANSAARAIE